MLVTLQQNPRIDNISDDGHAMSQLPYPYHVNEKGEVQQQDFWQGRITLVVGFQKDLAVHRIDVYWDEVWETPEKAVGLYVVTSDGRGNWGVHDTAIRDAVKRDIKEF